MRTAVIDIGSNSIKLLVAEGENAAPFYEAHSETRLSPSVAGARERISDEAFAAGIAAVADLAAQADACEPAMLAIVGTSLFRSAENADEFADAVLRATGTPMRVLSGTQEAELVAAGVATEPAAGTPCAIFDLGGGSLEFIVKTADGVPARAESRPLGAVRLTRRFFRSPAGKIPSEELAVLREFLRSEFESFVVGKIPAEAKVILCGGAVGICAHFARGDLPRALVPNAAGTTNEPTAAGTTNAAGTDEAAHHSVSSTQISAALFDDLLKSMCEKTLIERIGIGVPLKRADIFPAALTVLSELCRAGKISSVLHTRRNLRYGLCALLSRGNGSWPF